MYPYTSNVLLSVYPYGNNKYIQLVYNTLQYNTQDAIISSPVIPTLKMYSFQLILLQSSRLHSDTSKETRVDICYAAAEINRHTCIMDQTGKQCSYDAMQLQNLTNMHILLLWAKSASNAAMLPCSCRN